MPRARIEKNDELAALDRRVDRAVHCWSGLAAGAVCGLYFAAHIYGGPSMTRGLSIAAGVALLIATLSFAFGERFWRVFAFLWWP